MGEISRTLVTTTVHPELVEGLSFFVLSGAEEGQGFDKLSPNGFGLEQR